MPTTTWIESVGEPKKRTIPAGLFSKSAKEIAEGLKRAVLLDPRGGKDAGLKLAITILTFYINRAGKSLPLTRRRELAKAKFELRKLFKEAHNG